MTYSAEYATDSPTRDDIAAIREPMVIEFGQPDCPHCQAAAPFVEAAFADFPGIVHMKLKDGEGQLLGRAFDVTEWPTLIFMQEGEESTRLVRPQSEQEVREALEEIDSKDQPDPDHGGTGGGNTF